MNLIDVRVTESASVYLDVGREVVGISWGKARQRVILC